MGQIRKYGKVEERTNRAIDDNTKSLDIEQNTFFLLDRLVTIQLDVEMYYMLQSIMFPVLSRSV